jgi:hypothetical protein
MSDRLAEVVRKIENRNGPCEEGLADTIFAPKVVAAIALGVQIGLQL